MLAMARAASRTRVTRPERGCGDERSAVDGAIVGFRHADHVAPIVRAANLELDDDDLATIAGTA